MQKTQELKNVEVVEYNEEEEFILVKIPTERLQCGINLEPTLFPVRTPMGDVFDADTIKHLKKEPLKPATPLRQEDVRPDPLCAELSLALFKKAPHIFTIGNKFQSLFEKSLNENDAEFAAALVANAITNKMAIDASELLLAAIQRKREKIFVAVSVELTRANYAFNNKKIRAVSAELLRKSAFEWVISVFTYLLENQIDMGDFLILTGIVDVTNCTPLYWACHSNLPIIARKILKHDASSVNTLNEIDGEDTALCVVARNGNAQLLIELIGCHANINLPGIYKQTPFMTAVAALQNALLPIFVRNNTLDWIALDEDLFSVMNIACAEGNVEGLEYLLENVPDQDKTFLQNYGPKNRTLLGVAIKEDENCALLLIEKEIGLFSLSDGKSPLDIAKSVGHQSVVQALEDYYQNHIKEIFLLLVNPTNGCELLMNSWITHKQAIVNFLSDYTQELLQGELNSIELKIVRSAINCKNDPKSVLQKYFELPVSFLDRFRSKPWPEMLQSLEKEVNATLSADNQEPTLFLDY